MRLLVVTLCCFVAPPIVRADPTEDAAIKAIKQLHGKVEQNGKVVDLSYTQVTDAELKELAALKNLTTLDLFRDEGDGCRVEGTGGTQEPHHPPPRWPGTYIGVSSEAGRKLTLTDADLKELAALKNLSNSQSRLDKCDGRRLEGAGGTQEPQHSQSHLHKCDGR